MKELEWYNAEMSSLHLQSCGSGTGFENNGLSLGICGLSLESAGLVNIAGIIINV